jgi:hypothetical protein
LLDTQVALINQALEEKHLEEYQLEEPRRLVAERMTTILQTTDPSTPPGIGKESPA